MAAPSSVKMKANRKAISGPPANETAEPVSTTALGPANTEEELSRLAYSYWEERGCTGGSPEDD
jgi:hypothetical protein